MSYRDVLRRSSATALSRHYITRNNERIAVVIETLAIQAGDADSRNTAEEFEWARDNKAELRSRWQEYSEEEPSQE